MTLPLSSSADTCLQGAPQAMENHQEDLKPAMLRTLQQAAGATGSENVVSVATANEFQAAVKTGVRHITITEHLDFTNQEAAFYDEDGKGYKLKVLPSTWSIRVRPPCASLAIAVEEYTGSSRVASLKGTVRCAKCALATRGWPQCVQPCTTHLLQS
jgi:urease beta subunit